MVGMEWRSRAYKFREITWMLAHQVRPHALRKSACLVLFRTACFMFLYSSLVCLLFVSYHSPRIALSSRVRFFSLRLFVSINSLSLRCSEIVMVSSHNLTAAELCANKYLHCSSNSSGDIHTSGNFAIQSRNHQQASALLAIGVVESTCTTRNPNFLLLPNLNLLPFGLEQGTDAPIRVM